MFSNLTLFIVPFFLFSSFFLFFFFFFFSFFFLFFFFLGGGGRRPPQPPSNDAPGSKMDVCRNVYWKCVIKFIIYHTKLGLQMNTTLCHFDVKH